jgi:hypothetical protein
MFYIVNFHADGGQACIPGRRVFTNAEKALKFAERMRNEPGHTCENSVSLITSDTYPGDDKGEIYRP